MKSRATPQPAPSATAPPPIPPPDRQPIMLGARDALLVKARKDIHVFLELVLRDEESKQPVRQAPLHVRMQAAYEKNRKLVLMLFPESGKTQQFSVGRVLFNLGNNPNLRVMLLQNTQAMASKSLGQVKQYIERSEELRAVFPDLLPGPVWTSSSITVQRDTISKDFSVQAVGYHGDVQGSRVDELIADDLLDYENTRTKEQREETRRWWGRQVMNRLTANARATFLTNFWHREDLAHTLQKMGWHTVRIPVMDAKTGAPSYPERWPADRIAAVRKTEVGERDFWRTHMLEDRNQLDQLFDFSEARRLGEGYEPVEALETPPGCLIVTGVDLAATKAGRGNALTAMFTLLFHPDGTRQPLWCESGQWKAGEILDRLEAVSHRYPDGFIAVESNAAQVYLVELAHENSRILAPVVPFYTGRNKLDPRYGFASMSLEINQGKWMLPCVGGVAHEELEAWAAEMEAYDPDSHTGDRAMASYVARTFGMKMIRDMTGGGREVGATVVG